MVTIGNDILPGIVAEMESGDSANVSVGTPGTPLIVGQGDLTNGSADADTIYRVTRPKRARDLFGAIDKSLLTQNVVDALIEGAYPVYAMSPPSTETTDDLSGETSTGTVLANEPVIEDIDSITLTVNSTEKNLSLFYDSDPSNETLDTDEALLNPQSGVLEVDESMGNTGDEITYSHADYTNTFDAIDDAMIGNTAIKDIIDFIAVVDENDVVVNSAKNKADALEAEESFVIAVAGAGEPYIDDTASYTNDNDTSRLQLIYPSRKADRSHSVIGAYIGRRSILGISATPMSKRIRTLEGLQFRLSQAQKENLVNERVNPLNQRRNIVRIIEDYTTVSDDNTNESSWRRGFDRLVTDFVTEVVIDLGNQYIGRLNIPHVRNSLESDISNELTDLLDSDSIEGASLVVEENDSTSANVDVGLDITDPLRNIYLTVTAGEVLGEERVEG